MSWRPATNGRARGHLRGHPPAPAHGALRRAAGGARRFAEGIARRYLRAATPVPGDGLTLRHTPAVAPATVRARLALHLSPIVRVALPVRPLPSAAPAPGAVALPRSAGVAFVARVAVAAERRERPTGAAIRPSRGAIPSADAWAPPAPRVVRRAPPAPVQPAEIAPVWSPVRTPAEPRPPVDLDPATVSRLTDQVVHAIDRRIAAYRERRGQI